MIARKQRTMEIYENTGALMRLLKTIGTKAIVEVSPVLLAKDSDKMIKALNMVDEICSKAEESMFSDYPDLTDKYIDVFYGALNYEPRNEVDERIIQKARTASDELFKRE